MSKILVLGRTMDMGGTEVAMAALLQKLVEKKEDWLHPSLQLHTDLMGFQEDRRSLFLYLKAENPHPASIPAAIIAVKVIAITFLFIIFFSPLFTRDFCDFYFVKSQSRCFLHFVFTGIIITTACKMQNLEEVKFM